MLGRTPNESMLVSKKLLALVSKSLRTIGAILVSVIRRPKNKNFLTAISDSKEFSSESFKSKCLGVNLGTKKRFLRNHSWHLSNFSIKVGVTVDSSTPYSKEGRQACRQKFNVYKRVDLSTIKTRCKYHTRLFPGFVNVIFDIRREWTNVIFHYPRVLVLITFINSFVTKHPVTLFNRLTMGSFCFSKSDNTAFMIMKFIPPSNTVFVAKVHESTKKSRMSCQQRNVISKRKGWKTEHADRNCKGMLSQPDK